MAARKQARRTGSVDVEGGGGGMAVPGWCVGSWWMGWRRGGVDLVWAISRVGDEVRLTSGWTRAPLIDTDCQEGRRLELNLGDVSISVVGSWLVRWSIDWEAKSRSRLIDSIIGGRCEAKPTAMRM